MEKKIKVLYDACLCYARDLGMEAVFVNDMKKHTNKTNNVRYTYLKAHSAKLKKLINSVTNNYYENCLCVMEMKRLKEQVVKMNEELAKNPPPKFSFGTMAPKEQSFPEFSFGTMAPKEQSPPKFSFGTMAPKEQSFPEFSFGTIKENRRERYRK